jgi:hypothetical protein
VGIIVSPRSERGQDSAPLLSNETPPQFTLKISEINESLRTLVNRKVFVFSTY